MMTTKEDLANLIDNAVAARIKDIPQMVEQMMQSAILSLLGLQRDSWARAATWKMDHCNSRANPLVDLVKKVIGDNAREYVEKHALSALKEVSKNRKFHTAIKKEAKEIFERQVRSAVRERIESAVKDYANEMVEELLPVIKVEFDKANPSSAETAVGQLLLEQEAERIVSSEEIGHE